MGGRQADEVGCRRGRSGRGRSWKGMRGLCLTWQLTAASFVDSAPASLLHTNTQTVDPTFSLPVTTSISHRNKSSKAMARLQPSATAAAKGKPQLQQKWFQRCPITDLGVADAVNGEQQVLEGHGMGRGGACAWCHHNRQERPSERSPAVSGQFCCKD